MSESKFGRLRLSVEGTTNGRGFDILYDFGKNHDFVEFTTQKEFYFIQPWMQFPNDEYSDTCKLVSIEVVTRFNEYDELKRKISTLTAEVERLDNVCKAFMLQEILLKASNLQLRGALEFLLWAVNFNQETEEHPMPDAERKAQKALTSTPDTAALSKLLEAATDMVAIMVDLSGQVCVRDINHWSLGDIAIADRFVEAAKEAGL